jgi:sodium/proline symporter
MGEASNATGVVLATLVIYKIVLIGIGIWAARLNKNESDFFLGGQGLGPWVAGLSYAASTSSAWVLLGFSGFVYASRCVRALDGARHLGRLCRWFGSGSDRGSGREPPRHGHVTATDFMAARAWPLCEPRG